MKRELIELRASVMISSEKKEQQDRNAKMETFIFQKGGKQVELHKRIPEYMQILFNHIAGQLLLQDAIEIKTEIRGDFQIVSARLVIDTTPETAKRLKEL